MNILSQEGLTFDDVLLVPRYSTIDSRFDGSISLKTKVLLNIELELPIISANMDTVTNGKMAQAMHDAGGLGIIHRFMSPEQHVEELLHPIGPKVLCIGVGKSSRARLDLVAKHHNLDAILIDIAHGHCSAMEEQIKWVKDYYSYNVIAGNISTYESALFLINAGADCIKVGQGCGANCSTRIHTGNGMPQLTAIAEVKKAITEVNKPVFLIADGGIKNAGDMVKAFAVGADAVMVGNLLAGTDESPGEVFGNSISNIRYKVYRGMASAAAELSWKGFVSSVEGEMTQVPLKGPVYKVLQGLKAGILSGMSYQDAHDLSELQKNHLFIRQTISGYRESMPHGLL